MEKRMLMHYYYGAFLGNYKMILGASFCRKATKFYN